MHETRPRRRIVVGVDGSLPSLFALRWAGRQAKLQGADLCAVTVDEDPVWPYGPYASARPSAGRAERWAALGKILVDSISAALGPCPDVPVHEHVEEGRASDVLGRYSEGADLLVLGSRQRAESDGSPALGPTVRGCIRTATCPVVAVSDGQLAPWSPARISADVLEPAR